MDHIAKVSDTVEAPIARVWDALVTPDIIKQYMFGAKVSSDWRVGSKISWSGEWQGKPYEDKGKILEFRPEERLSYSHFSPLLGKPDEPANYHRVVIELSERAGGTEVTISQDNNATDEARVHSAKNWRVMLDGLKQVLEARG